MEFFLTNLKTKEKIAEKRKTTEETESKLSNPKLAKKNEPTRKIWEKCIRSLANRNIYPLAKLGKCNSNLSSTILKQLVKMTR